MLRKALLATAASERVRELATVTPAARTVASRYVAGESIQEAVDVARSLRAAGLLVTLSYLGEETRDAQRAAATAAQYAHLVSKLAAEGLTGGGAVEVSVKPSALGLMLAAEGETGPGILGQRVAAEHLARIAAAARDAGTTVTVDAEDHRTTDAALRTATALRARWPADGRGSVGSVVQAALRRAEADVRELAAPGVRVRLCKGGYAERPGQAFADEHEVDKSFARCLRILMAGAGYPMIATHDRRLIAITRSLGLDRSPASFEYQMLYGVRPDDQRKLAASGAQVRVYVPYGGNWYGYLIRRLAERPANLALFLRSLGSRP